MNEQYNPTEDDPRNEWGSREWYQETQRLDAEIVSLTAEGALKDEALALAWEALRWADSPDEGDPCDQWTEIPRNRAEKAFNAIWAAMGEKAPASGSQCSYWAMVDKGRTSYPYEEHWRDCDICQKRDPNRVEHRIAVADSRPTTEEGE